MSLVPEFSRFLKDEPRVLMIFELYYLLKYCQQSFTSACIIYSSTHLQETLCTSRLVSQLERHLETEKRTQLPEPTSDFLSSCSSKIAAKYILTH